MSLGLNKGSRVFLTTGDPNETIESAVAVGESSFERRQAIRQAARKAFMDADHELKVKRACAPRARPRTEPLVTGDLVYIWCKGVGQLKACWHDPGHVLGAQG